jgi:hypothetical protein
MGMIGRSRYRQLQEKIRRLEDIEEIRRLAARYAELNDSGKDPDSMVELFTEDGVWENPLYGRFMGRDAMREYWIKQRGATTWSLHYLTNHIIDISPDGIHADARWYQAGAFRQAREENIFGSWYTAECVRTAKGWRFSKLSLERRFLTPAKVGWLGLI